MINPAKLAVMLDEKEDLDTDAIKSMAFNCLMTNQQLPEHFQVVEASSRSIKLAKEAAERGPVLLQHELDGLIAASNSLKSHPMMASIYAEKDLKLRFKVQRELAVSDADKLDFMALVPLYLHNKDRYVVVLPKIVADIRDATTAIWHAGWHIDAAYAVSCLNSAVLPSVFIAMVEAKAPYCTLIGELDVRSLCEYVLVMMNKLVQTKELMDGKHGGPITLEIPSWARYL